MRTAPRRLAWCASRNQNATSKENDQQKSLRLRLWLRLHVAKRCLHAPIGARVLLVII